MTDRHVITVRTATADDHSWVVETAEDVLSGAYQVHSRRQFHVLDGELSIAMREGRRVGFVTWVVEGGDCEVLSLATTERRVGAGSALMAAVGSVATSRGCSRIHLITTDDNFVAQAFYARLGYRLTERIVGGVDECRRLYKPTIPAHIHDELRYERIPSIPR